MTNHIDPDKVRELIKKWRGTTNQTMHRVNLVYEVAADDLESLLTPTRPTLDDLIGRGHDPSQSQWMQAEHRDERCIIIRINGQDPQPTVSLLTATGATIWASPDEVIPLPDLPRLVWPAESRPEPAEEETPEQVYGPGGVVQEALDKLNTHEPRPRLLFAKHDKHGIVAASQEKDEDGDHRCYIATDLTGWGTDHAYLNEDELDFIDLVPEVRGMSIPQIIRDPEDLNQIEEDTLIMDGHEDISSVEDLADHINDRPQAAETLFPAVVIASGEQVRTARQALEKE